MWWRKERRELTELAPKVQRGTLNSVTPWRHARPPPPLARLSHFYGSPFKVLLSPFFAKKSFFARINIPLRRRICLRRSHSAAAGSRRHGGGSLSVLSSSRSPLLSRSWYQFAIGVDSNTAPSFFAHPAGISQIFFRRSVAPRFKSGSASFPRSAFCDVPEKKEGVLTDCQYVTFYCCAGKTCHFFLHTLATPTELLLVTHKTMLLPGV